MKNLRESKTDFKKLAEIKDEDIDCSDIAVFDEAFLAKVEGFIETPEKERISIRIDKVVLDFYRKSGAGYQTRMNAVLKAYAETIKNKQESKCI